MLNLVLIRLLGAYDFGVFAIAFVLGGISLDLRQCARLGSGGGAHAAAEKPRRGELSGRDVRLDRAR